MCDEVDLRALLKHIGRSRLMCNPSTLCQKLSLTPTRPTLQKHINQASQKRMSETFYLSWWATRPVIDGPPAVSNCPTAAAAATATAPLLFYTCINLHTIRETTNDSVLKNDSQYPLAIEVNNFPFLKAGGKIETDSGREEGRETCQHCFLY